MRRFASIISAQDAENMTWIWQQPDWPALQWDEVQIAAPLAELRHEQGRLLGRMEALGFSLRDDALLHTLTTAVIETSEIEGEWLDQAKARSPLPRRLGIETGASIQADRHVEASST